MLLDEFKALLWVYGGNLGSGSGHVDPETARQPDLFLLASSNFISSDARVATCVFNIVSEMADKFSPELLEKQMPFAKHDSRRLGVLVSIIRNELNRREVSTDTRPWDALEVKLRSSVDTGRPLEPLISHLPRLPGHRDPTFLAWGFEYPGIVREPAKYLRKAV